MLTGLCLSLAGILCMGVSYLLEPKRMPEDQIDMLYYIRSIAVFVIGCNCTIGALICFLIESK